MPTIQLPTLHPGQVQAYKLKGRFKGIRCGRRWGKTDFGKVIAGDGAAKGQNIGWFTPDYKIQSEAYSEILEVLSPIKKAASKIDGVIRTTTGGRIDFWTLENERAGRSRKYHKVIIDEAAFTKPNMMMIWETAIKPSLLDFEGSAYALSTPNGDSSDNFFHEICTDPKHGFVEFHAPTRQNPHVPLRRAGESLVDWNVRREAEFEAIKAANHPLVYRQEYLAEFVDWSGVAFFTLDKMLHEDKAVIWPEHIDCVFATIDSATKAGQEHDGTAVVYWGLSKHVGHPLVVLDWDIVQIEGALLETWLPTVFQQLEFMAGITKARSGSIGAFIEDKSSGTILIQQAMRRGWPAQAIDSKLTSLGKDERAISVSGYVYRGMVKFSQRAYDKVTTFKGQSRNHCISQILGFRIGDKDAAKRADDLLDAFVYGVAIALGNSEGY
jgi:hypothetical protein